jgi:hypothetical protein
MLLLLLLYLLLQLFVWQLVLWGQGWLQAGCCT